MAAANHRSADRERTALTMSMRIRPGNLFFSLLLIVAVISMDQFSKVVIVELVMQPPRVIPVTDFLNLMLSYNTGVSFGLFADWFRDAPGYLNAITSGIVLGLVFWASVATKRLEASALGLIAGGASGNILDRLQRGAVTDFIDLHIAEWHWPAFNLADVAITVGAALLIGMSFRRGANR